MRVHSWYPRQKSFRSQRAPDLMKSPGGVRQMQCLAIPAVSLKLLLNKLDQAFVFGHGLHC